MLNRILSSILIVSLLCLTGCTSVSNEEIENLIEKDPSFKQVLEEQKRIDAEIFFLKKELKGKKKIISSKIAILREEFKKEKTKVTSEIKGLKHRLDSERTFIKDEKNLLKRDIKEKEAAIGNIERTIKDLNNLLSREETLDISREETARWHQRIKLLEDEKRSIKKELRSLRGELEILETKLRILK